MKLHSVAKSNILNSISLRYNFFDVEFLSDILFLQKVRRCRQMFWSDNRTWHALFPEFKTRFDPSIFFHTYVEELY